MRNCTFGNTKYDVCILCNPLSFNKQNIQHYYLTSVIKNSCIAIALPASNNSKTTAAEAKQNSIVLLNKLDKLNVKFIYCTDGTYFKALTKKPKSEPYIGYVLDCAISGYEHIKVILGINYSTIIFKPDNQKKLDITLEALNNAYLSKPNKFSKSPIKKAYYPRTLSDKINAIESLHQYPLLACDVETYSLFLDKAGLGSIAFSYSSTEGISFLVDVEDILNEDLFNSLILNKLKIFFETYKGTLIFHNSPFDIKVLIYKLWMKNFQDTENLINGLNYLTRSFHDTKVIAYLATNSTAGNQLSLKQLSQEYLGNYALNDINNITKIDPNDLLKYNLADTCATFWVYEKYYPKLLKDAQEDIYYNLMLPSQKLITQCEITGMPLNPQRVQEVKQILQADQNSCIEVFKSSDFVKQTEEILKKLSWEKDYLDRKKKAKHPDKILKKDFNTFPSKPFNPNSSIQLQTLLYAVIGLPILERTDKGQPATGNKVLAILKNHTKNPKVLELLDALVKHTLADKILTTFITAFEKAIPHGEDGIVWLHGSLNLNGTATGRMSSSDPNLQAIPSNSTYAKLIKSCFQAPPGYVFAGSDFNSLEDKVSALQTGDPNKLKVYTQGYDSHCLRAHAYFKNQMPDIELAENTEQCWEVTLEDNTTLLIKSSDTINYQGQSYKPLDFIELIKHDN